MTDQDAGVAIYSTHVEAEEAVKELQRGGVDMKASSIVGKGTHRGTSGGILQCGRPDEILG
jgi:hypothetical protein